MMFRRFFAAVALLSASLNSFPSHIVGGEITYQWIGGKEYVVSVVLYRDCMGVAGPSAEIVGIGSSSCGIFFSGTLPLVHVEEISLVCPGLQTTCQSGSYIGIQALLYSDTVTIPAACPDWVFSTSTCCRTPLITNLSDPGAESIYITSHLNNTLGPNSSPVFSNWAFPVMYANNQVVLDFHAWDRDGDSLVYALVPAMDGPSTPVDYSTGFSATYPFTTSSGQVYLEPMTGVIQDSVIGLQVPVICIGVTEYRNGQLVGSIKRDLTFFFIQGSNTFPDISGIDSLSVYSVDAHPGDTVDFLVYGFDPDSGQSLLMYYDTVVQSAYFMISYNPLLVGHFHWEIDPGILPGNYLLPVMIQDDACPYSAARIRNYQIRVLPTVSVGVEPRVPVPEVKVFPQPAADVVHWRFSRPVQGELLIYDLRGRLAGSLPVSGSNRITWHGNQIAPGIYLWKFRGMDFSQQGTLVIQ